MHASLDERDDFYGRVIISSGGFFFSLCVCVMFGVSCGCVLWYEVCGVFSLVVALVE